MGKYSNNIKQQSHNTFETVLSVCAALIGEVWLFILAAVYTYRTLNASNYELGKSLCYVMLMLGGIYAGGSCILDKNGGKKLKQAVKSLFCKEQLLLLGILALYFISCAVLTNATGLDYTTANRYYLLDAVYSVCILFPLPMILKKRPIIAKLMLHVLMAVITVFDVWALSGVLKPGVVTLSNGRQIGMTANYDLTVCCNVNTTGAYHALLFMIALYFIVSDKLWIKLVYIPVSLVHLFMLGLAGSRASTYATALACAAIAGALCIVYMRKKKLALPITLITAAVAAAAAGFVILYSSRICYAVYDWFTDNIRNKGGNGLAESSLVDLSLSARDLLWKTFWPALTENARTFFFGVTTVGVEDAITAQGFINGDGISYMHNQYLQMGVAFGFPSLVLYTIWTVLLAIKCVKLLKNNKGIALTAIVLMLVIANMAESYLFGFGYFCGAVFFLLAGMVNADTDNVLASEEKAL